MIPSPRSTATALAVLVTAGGLLATVDAQEGELDSASRLHFSTLLGGSSFDWVADMTTDAAGNIYVTGFAGAPDFPATLTIGPAGFGGPFIAKFSPDADALLYSVVIRASAATGAAAIAVDPQGSAYVVGHTSAPDFPTVNPFQAANQLGGECECDAFLLKLSASGDRLVYATFLGGNNDDWVSDVAVHTTGEAVVIGGTHSANFPLAAATDPTYGGGHDFETPGDGFAARFSASGERLVYSTYLHGVAGSSIALDQNGRAVVAGATPFATLPTTSNAPQRTHGGDYDGVLLRLTAAGAWQYATYLGGPGYDYPYGIALDGAGAAHVVFYSNGGGFPTTADAYQRAAPGGADAVIVTIAPSGTRTYASYYGGPDDDFPWALDVDGWGRATIAGTTFGAVPLTADALQPEAGGFGDAFVATFDGSRLAYATRLGGSESDGANAVAVHQSGRITIAGTTSSSDFPIRQAYQSECRPADDCGDAFITQLTRRPPGTFAPGDAIVLYAADANALSGAWRFVTDPDAAGGIRLEHPDAGAAKVPAPLANPVDYFEITTPVISGEDYEIWIRGKARGNSFRSDSVFVQYSDMAGGNGTDPAPLIGSPYAQTITLEDCSSCGLRGWGWQDAAFGFRAMAAAPGEFAGTSTTIRIQTREDGISIDQIVLLRNGRSDAPGFQKDDRTIYPRSSSGGLPAEIVLYAGDQARLYGAWRLAADGTAAAGLRATHPNAYAPKLPAAMASPVDYFDIDFEVAANTPYYFYLRGKADRDDPYNDSVYVQFTGTGWAPGTAAALPVNLETCAGAGLSGWGWRDNHWCDPEGDDGGGTITFSTAGRQTIRVQTREDGISIDQIVLSPSRPQPPGPPTGDTTIVPRQE